METTDREPRAADDQRHGPDVGPGGPLRPDDLQPHEGLRYLARLFKGLALLLVMLLIAEVAIGLIEHGTASMLTLMTTATRLVVFAGLLWGIGDIAVLLIESNHDLRASRILLARLLGALGQDSAAAGQDAGPPDTAAPTPKDDLAR